MAIRIDKPNAEDNLSYRQKKEKHQRIKVADLSDKMSIKDINEYIRRYQSGEGVIEIIPPGLTLEELKQLENLAKKRS